MNFCTNLSSLELMIVARRKASFSVTVASTEPFLCRFFAFQFSLSSKIFLWRLRGIAASLLPFWDSANFLQFWDLWFLLLFGLFLSSSLISRSQSGRVFHWAILFFLQFLLFEGKIDFRRLFGPQIFFDFAFLFHHFFCRAWLFSQLAHVAPRRAQLVSLSKCYISFLYNN